MSISPATVVAGDTVSFDVHTSPDVNAVDAHVRIATLELQRVAPGHFTLAFAIPKAAPALFHGNYTVEIVAHAAGGTTATRSASLDFH